MRSGPGDLLAVLAASHLAEARPWGIMVCLGSAEHDFTVKYLSVEAGHRTSLQRHDRKDELIAVLSGGGWVDAGQERYSGEGCLVRIRPGIVHRVTGPLDYLEVSSYDDGTDVIRLEDDYGRAP